jgi:hypothetical protein
MYDFLILLPSNIQGEDRIRHSLTKNQKVKHTEEEKPARQLFCP